MLSQSQAAPAAFATPALVTIPFKPRSIVFVNASANPADVIEVSLDGGKTVALKLRPGISPALGCWQRVQEIWAQCTTGALPVLEVIAEQEGP